MDDDKVFGALPYFPCSFLYCIACLFLCNIQLAAVSRSMSECDCQCPTPNLGALRSTVAYYRCETPYLLLTFFSQKFIPGVDRLIEVCLCCTLSHNVWADQAIKIV